MQDTQPKRNTRLFQNTDLTNRYGRTQRTVDRWKRKKILPPPDLIINGAPYWYPETIEANERAHLSGTLRVSPGLGRQAINQNRPNL